MNRLVVILVLLASFNTHASDEEDAKLLFCGSLAQIKQAFGNPTKAELAELVQSRKGMTNVLKNGKKAMKDLLDSGSKNDIGAFPLLGTCGMIVNLKAEIRQGKCFDLETNTPLADKGAVGACEQVLESLEKRR